MIACTYRPNAALSAFVEDFWLYDGYASAHARERILPSGTFELVFNLRENEIRIYGAESARHCRRYSGAVVSGPYAGYFGSDALEEISIIGVHFKPGGAFPILGPPAGDFADRHVDLGELWKSHAEILRARLAEAASATDRFRLLERSLMHHLRRPLEHHPAVADALQRLERRTDGNRTAGLARAVGLSERRFIEVFRAEVGVTPKVFMRIQRFQRALSAARKRTSPDWVGLAADCGYFDQSHLIRDFRQFTGITPANYTARLHALRAEGAYTKRNHLPLAD